MPPKLLYNSAIVPIQNVREFDFFSILSKSGLAQIKGRYATKPKDKLRYDIVYMKNMSPLLDFVLLVMSVLVTLKAGWQASRDGKR